MKERTVEVWTARRDASKDPCPCDGHPIAKCMCEGACSCHWEQTSVPRAAEHQDAAEPTPPAEDAPHSPPEAPLDPPPLAPPDAAAAFVSETCKPNRKAFTCTAEIMAAARGWCDEHNAMSFGPRTLAAQLRRLGGQPHSNGQRRGWRGIKLR